MAAYIKFDGVDGESQHDGHKGWCDLLSFQQMTHNTQAHSHTGGGGGGGNAQYEDISCTKVLDKASPKLLEKVTNGLVFAKVEIELQTSSTGDAQKTYLKYELKNVLVSSYAVSGGSQDKPHEQFSLRFSEIKQTYTEIGLDGKKGGDVAFGWDIQKAKAV